jgi:TrmH family RNA methyltransferase
MERVTSRHNPVVQSFRQAAHEHGPSILLDGEHLIATALDVGLRIEVAAVRGDGDHASAEVAPLVERLVERGARVIAVPSAVLDAISPVRTPSGIVALAERPRPAADRLLQPAPALLLIAVSVQDPGNVGAIIRAADAGGATGVVTTVGSADPYGWKALRGSMGSALRLPLWARAEWPHVERLLSRHGVDIVAATPRAPTSLYDLTWDRPAAVLLGTEGQGLPPAIEACAHRAFAVPMRTGVESLNVAVTAALVAFEAQRWRRLNADGAKGPES